VTKPETKQSIVGVGVGLGVSLGVGVGVGVYVIPVATKFKLLHTLDGVGVTVGVGVGVNVGVTVGVGVTSQLNNASKSIMSQLLYVVVVLTTQYPSVKNVSHKSGQLLKQGDLPKSSQGPSNTEETHQQVSPVE
jgi:hypothetical protein